jgi:hypothetical protein
MENKDDTKPDENFSFTLIILNDRFFAIQNKTISKKAREYFEFASKSQRLDSQYFKLYIEQDPESAKKRRSCITDHPWRAKSNSELESRKLRFHIACFMLLGLEYFMAEELEKIETEEEPYEFYGRCEKDLPELNKFLSNFKPLITNIYKWAF